jgi:hypothetical protein
MAAARGNPRAARLLAVLLILGLVLGGCQAASNAPSPASTQPAAALSATPVPSFTPSPTPPAATLTPEPLLATAAPVASQTSAPEPQVNLVAPSVPFDGDRAYQDVIHQVNLGPRIPATPPHAAAIDWIRSELEKNGWEVILQETTQNNQPVRNVIAKRGSGSPWRIVGAHFDTRMVADNDPDPANRQKPVPGANDGASGVAVLLELARVLPEDTPGEVWLAFFDSEDQGRLPGWDWILGSRAMAASLDGVPDAVVIVDMIGDADLNIYHETNSDPGLTKEIWSIAKLLGYEQQFIPQPKYTMIDDHTPFLQRGIRAVDLIDFDYPYWHTISDTPDKVSASSLKAVGDTVLHWLLIAGPG